MDQKQMIHYAIIALLLVSIGLLSYHIRQMKKMAAAERFGNFPTSESAEHFNVEGDTSNAAEHFRRKNDLAAERFNVYSDERFARRGPGADPPTASAERFAVPRSDEAPMAAHLHTRLNRNTGRLYTGEAFGMRKRLN